MTQLRITTSINEDVFGLLAESVIGTPGSGMLYQHKSIDKRIKLIQRPFFVSLWTKTRLIATCCFCFRESLNHSETIPAFYVRYFSFKENYRARPRTGRRRRHGKLRQEILKLLEGDSFDIVSGKKFFNYACVDLSNSRSRALCTEFGFQEVRRFTTFLFTRINPKAETTPVFRLKEDEAPEMKRLLRDRYSAFNMFSIDDSFDHESYYVVRDLNGKIVAGANVTPTHWKIFGMQNRLTTAMVSLLSYVPVIRRLINKEFRFLAIDALYYTDGCEDYTEEMLTYVLAKYQHHIAFIPADSDSSLFRHLQKLDLGPVNNISKQVSASVICRFIDFTSEEIQRFKQYPAYVSALDIT